MKNRLTRKIHGKNIVVIGGGTGTYTVLTGLKKYPVNLTAIVTMADDGGSTGLLRDELGVLPPGDVRRCLVALSSSDLTMRELMNYRFENGSLKGHSFGNIFLSALEKVTGSFDEAIEKASEILRLKGRVVPVTLDKVRLFGYFQNGKVLRHEFEFHRANLRGLRKVVLQPRARLNPKAAQAISHADALLIGPGDFYSSLLPNLLVEGVSKAILKSKGKKIFICNLMTKKGHTDGWTVRTFTEHIETYLGGPVTYVIYNNRMPDAKLLGRYALEDELPVKVDKDLPKNKFIGADLINRKPPQISKSDPLAWKRTLIRHHPDRLARRILKIISQRE